MCKQSKIENLITIANKNKCEYKLNEEMKNYTTFKVGGPCLAMFFINSNECLKELIKEVNISDLNFLTVGKGSNMLIDDKGFDGVVFLIGKDFSDISLTSEDEITVCAGCSMSTLCKFALDNSLSGLEFAYGIPGTVGGALYMNAGAYGGEMKNVVKSACGIDNNGEEVIIKNTDMDLSYRHSIFCDRNMIISSITLKLDKADKNAISDKMKELLLRRKEKQPLEYPSAGSTFKRPEGQFAGKLIEDCGLKGYSIGGAEVSTKHCGFVINKDNATFSDITTLIKDVQKIVLDKTGYFLECEVKIYTKEN